MSTMSFEEEKLPDKFNISVWLRVLKYTIKHWPLLLILLLTLTMTSFYDSSFIPLMNYSAIKAIQLFHGQNVWGLVINVTLIFGIEFDTTFLGYMLILLIGILIRSVAIFVTFFVTNYLEMIVMTSLRRDTFRRIQELSFSYFDKTPSGWLIARMQNDTSSIGDILSWGIIRMIWVSFDIIFTLVSMFSTNWIMSLVILATTPLIMITAPLFEMALLKAHRIARNAYSNYVRWIAECISGAKTIKTLSIEDSIYDEAKEVTSDINKKRAHAQKIASAFYPTISLIGAVATAIVILVGLNFFDLSNETAETVSLFILFIGFVKQVYNPLQEVSELFSDFMGTQASVEKVLSLLDTKPQIVDTPDVIEKYGTVFENKKENFEKLEGDVNFVNVSFSYIKDVEVIHNLNLHISKGTSVAIVGETGSGKSTTVNLLCRFYEPTTGELLIDGVDYRKRSVGWLRSNIGYVQQTPFVFGGTYADNIRYGKLDATIEEIKEAAKLVDIDSFIMSQPKGYDTVLEDGGSELSVGQKQLISFARAIIRNPSIMILDEATSSIDTETEAVIQKAMNKVLKGRTSLVIAHRLSTIINCDRILVMKDGVILEDGNHVDLMNKKGYYFKLYTNQFAELKIETQIETYKSQITNLKIKV